MISEENADQIVQRLDHSDERGGMYRRLAMEEISKLPGYDWSGIYRMENGELVLDEFVGEPTEHTHIAVGVGVCGTAVKEDRNVLVEDVRTLKKTIYLAASRHVRKLSCLFEEMERFLDKSISTGIRLEHSIRRTKFLERIADLIASRW